MGSQFLYATPSFLEGLGRLFDFGGTLTEFNYALTEEQAEYLAMRADWQATGDDLRRAMDAFGKDLPSKR